MFTGNRALMGNFANRRTTQLTAIVGTVLVLALNLMLLAQLVGV
jgi:manganese transport protein